MKKRRKPKGVFAGLAELYANMQEAYDKTAREIGFTCEGCPQNCCVSYFEHHTYVEWAYLWRGLGELPKDRLEEIKARAGDCVRKIGAVLRAGLRPRVMCPLNQDGLCVLYKHRLMICRMHGVPHSVTTPDGQTKDYPGCFRCTEAQNGRPDVPVLDRTPFYMRLAELEKQYLGGKMSQLPRVRLTTAELIVQGPPKPTTSRGRR